MQESRDDRSKAPAVIVRLYWAFFGNVILYFLLAVIIVEKRAMSFPLLDAAYWITVASLVVVRYLDIRYLKGHTGCGDPASLKHWRRYVATLVPTTFGFWLGAHGLGRLLE